MAFFLLLIKKMHKILMSVDSHSLFIHRCSSQVSGDTTFSETKSLYTSASGLSNKILMSFFKDLSNGNVVTAVTTDSE